MRFPSKIDRYLIRNFLLTFVVAISLIIGITIVFDISERLDGFIGKYGQAPTLKEIIVDYYFNFIPFFVNLFSPLFVFISAIYFTSRMAYRLEIISIITSGWSYRRLVLPYATAALMIGFTSYSLSNWVIPRANEGRLAFERTYFRKSSGTSPNLHQRISKNEFIFAERYNPEKKQVINFAYEWIENGKLTYRILARTAEYDSISGTWMLKDYFARNLGDAESPWRLGERLDTIFPFTPEVFNVDLRQIEIMTNRELSDFIEKERAKGSANLDYYLLEKHSRNANPATALILTLIALPVSSRKLRGGIGIQLAFGVALAFGYILIQKVTYSFTLSGSLSPFLGVWLPNIIFAGVGIILAKFAQR
jgi:lipopolysaccharide export system permease protein